MENIHGGDIYTEGLLKGRNLLDFSSNINPFGVPGSFKERIEEALEKVERYPDIQYREIIHHLKEYTGRQEGYFLLGNGAAEIIDVTIQAFTGKKVLLTAPSFAEYEISARKWQCPILYSFLQENMEYNYEDIKIKFQEAEVLILGNPNNPNGGIINKEAFMDILEYAEKKEKKVILDEAFIEFVVNQKVSFTEWVEKYNSLVVIRALTKFFGMPGIRFGYGIMKDKVFFHTLKGKQIPWNINCFAELAVKTVLKDEKYIKDTLEWITEEKIFLQKKLKELSFMERVFPTEGNFILCKLKSMSAEELYRQCLEKGILIRKADNYVGLSPYYVRFAIKDRKSNLQLIHSLKEIEETLQGERLRR